MISTLVTWSSPPQDLVLVGFFVGIAMGLEAIFQARVPIPCYIYVNQDSDAWALVGIKLVDFFARFSDLFLAST